MKRVGTSDFWCSVQSGITALFLVVSLLPSQALGQEESLATQSTARSSLEQWLSLQEQMRGLVDRRFIELNTALDATEFDIDEIVRFVEQQIAFEAYPGLVRGALGTLQSRAGNSLDQAILLATLLKDAGYDARIVQANLSDESSSLALRQMARELEPVQVFTEGAENALFEIAGFLNQRTSSEGSGELAWEKELEERRELAEAIGESLNATLAKNELPLDLKSPPTEFFEEARQYFWCQYRHGPGSDWKDAHPIFSEAPLEFENLQPDRYFADEIPQELVQKLTIDLVAEVRKGSKSQSSPIMSTWTRPVANIHDMPIKISLIPSGFSKIGEEDYDSSSGLFLPYLNDSIAPGASAIDLNGNVVPADAALSNMAGVFKTVSDKGASAATALQGLGKSDDEPPAPAMALEDVWLEISLSGPGVGPNARWRRSFRSNHGRDLPTGESLAREVVLNLSSALPSDPKLYDQSLRLHIEALKSTLNRQKAMNSDSFESLGQRSSAEYQVDHGVLNGIADFISLLKIVAPDGGDGISYRPTPLIIAYHHNLLPESEEPEGIDIINNARHSFEFDEDGELRFSPALNLEFGTAEAVAEHAVMDDRYDHSIDAVRDFKPVLAGSSPLVFKDPAGIQDRLREGSVSQARISEAVANGEVVIAAPETKESGVRTWWAIDPGTGRTIARTQNGWGGSYLVFAASTEDIITRRIVIAVTCMMIVNSSCRMYSRVAVAAVANGIAGAGWAGCKLFFLVGPGSNLPPTPPGAPDPCDALKQGPTYLIRALRGMEERLYEYCYKRALPECIKAAAR